MSKDTQPRVPDEPQPGWDPLPAGYSSFSVADRYVGSTLEARREHSRSKWTINIGSIKSIKSCVSKCRVGSTHEARREHSRS